jgi:DNA-binding NarL/FixJ family response regulator
VLLAGSSRLGRSPHARICDLRLSTILTAWRRTALRRSVGYGGGWSPPTRPWAREILRAFEDGYSLRAIAEAAGMSHETVRAIVAHQRGRARPSPS